MTENLQREVANSIKSLFDLTSRMDERVKMMVEKQSQLEDKIDNLSKTQADLTTQVTVLDGGQVGLSKLSSSLEEIEDEIVEIDIRLRGAEKTNSSFEKKWSYFLGFIRDTVWVIVVCYLLYKLNLQAPPLP